MQQEGMFLVKPEKNDLVQNIRKRLTGSQVAVLTDYRGLTANEMTDLRRGLREVGIDFKIFKNTLTRIAAKECDLEELEEFLTGPTAIAFGFDNPEAAAKIVSNFSKEHEGLKIKGGILDGEVIPATAIKALASLPSREELLAKLAGSLNAPIFRLVNVLSNPIRGFVNALNQITTKQA
jgi:large subunit ribosomal protein L10